MITTQIIEKTTQPGNRQGVYWNILDTIGYTPLVKLNKVVPENIAASVFAKVEFFNPGGSIKDRIGLSIVREC